MVATPCLLVCALYLAGLTSMGLVSTDEPRYAAIGQAMAQTGDWITPRLWGLPWFEKPPLLFWMTAAGFRAGLGPELAPRLPVAMMSVAFLGFFWWFIRGEWNARVASYSTALLATSAGWLAYSHVAVTDLPLASFFSAAVLLSFRRNFTAAAACLGLAVMAKGLVPLVLFLPVWGMNWRRLGDWLRPGPVLAFAACALPWYVLCTIENGPAFLRAFFIDQQLQRFRTDALQHVQPWWFYFPVLLLFLYPWFPLLALPSRDLASEIRRDSRARTLAILILFGFVFFSASVNKLPGYVLPLLPSICLLSGLGLARTKVTRFALTSGVTATLALLGLLPGASRVLPAALAHGLRSVHIPWFGVLAGLGAGALAGGVLSLTAQKFALRGAMALAGVGLIWFQFSVFPGIDQLASARPVWLRSHPACASEVPRSLIYGLNYYAGRALQNCTIVDQSQTRVVR